MKKLFFIFLMFIPSIMIAGDLEISWKAVAGNNGYQIELRKSGEIDGNQYKTETNSYNFIKIDPGKYFIRVAALNKFRKPSRFTEWKEIVVTAEKAKQQFNLDKKTVQEDRKKTSKLYSVLPGLVQWQHGDKIKGAAYWVLLGALAYEGNHSRISGNKLADRQTNQQSTLLLLSWQQPAQTVLALAMNRNSDRAEYDQLQNRQRTVGALALFTFLFHIYDLRSYNDRKTTVNFDYYNNNRESGGFLSFNIRY